MKILGLQGSFTTRCNTMKALIAAATCVLLMSLAVGATVAPANATLPDVAGVDAARGSMIGKCIRNTRTHVRMCVRGTYKYHRRIHVHGHLVRKTFWGAIVETQRCSSNGCYGRTKIWRLPPRKLYGKPAGRRVIAPRSSDCPASLIGAVSLCSVPWTWLNNEIQRPIRKVVSSVVKPCVTGGLAGYGGIAAGNLWVRIFMQDGVITTAKAASMFTGPEGMAVTSAAACTVAVGSKGVNAVTDLFR